MWILNHKISQKYKTNSELAYSIHVLVLMEENTSKSLMQMNIGFHMKSFLYYLTR